MCLHEFVCVNIPALCEWGTSDSQIRLWGISETSSTPRIKMLTTYAYVAAVMNSPIMSWHALVL